MNIDERVAALQDKYRCPNCETTMVAAERRGSTPLYKHLPSTVEIALVCPSCHHVESGDDRL